MNISDLNKPQKYDFCLKILSISKENLSDPEAVSFVEGALDLCMAWNDDHSLDITTDLYNYLDGEPQSFSLYEQSAEDEKTAALWNCIIDSAAYICRGAFEAQGTKYFPEPIEAVDDSVFEHLEESFLQFGGRREELERLISDCSKTYGRPSFGYNRFADLFYYLLAHMPLDNAADEYDPEYVSEMKACLGVFPEIPREVIDYYGAHFDRVMIIDFISLTVPDTRMLKGMLAGCGMLTDEDMNSFADPMIGICDRVAEKFDPWWDAHHAKAMELMAETVYDRFRKLTERFKPFFDNLGMDTKVLFSHTLRHNGRAFNQPGMIVVYLTFPGKKEDITGCFLQYLHECTHSVTDPMMEQEILMADGSHDIAEYRVLCFDEYLIAEVSPELSEIYREWIGPEYLDEAHEHLGTDGENRLKERLKEMLAGSF